MLAQDIELLLEYAGKLRVEEHISSGLYFENKELAYIEIFANEDVHSNDITTKLYVDATVTANLTQSYDKFRRIIKDNIKQEELRREYVLRNNRGSI